MATYQVETEGGTYQVETDDASPDQSSVGGSVARGALDAIPFGDKAAAYIDSNNLGHNTYEKNLSNIDANLATDKAQHPIAHGTGEVVGSVAPFAIPGVGEALGVEGIAGRAAVGAGLGALQGASNNRDSNTMVGDIAKNAGIGAIAQPLVGALGDAAGSLGDMVSGSKLGNRADATLFAQSNGFNPMSMRKLAQASGEDPETAVNEMAQKINAIVPKGYYSPTSSINDKTRILQQMLDERGSTMGISRNAASQQPLEETQDIINELSTKAANWKDIAHPEGADSLKQASAALQAAQNKKPLTFSDLMSYKSAVGENMHNPASMTPGTTDIYGTLSKHLDSALDRLAPQDPNIDPAAFQKAKSEYSTISKMLPLMQRGAGREVNSALSPMKAITGIGSIAFGHPIGAAAMGVKAAQELGAPELPANLGMMARNAFKNGASIPNLPVGAAVANTVSNGLLDHPAMAPYRQTFQNAAQGVTDPAQREKVNATTDYVMSQSNPAYAAAKAKASE